MTTIIVCNVAEEGRFGGPERRITLVAAGLEEHAVSTVVLIPRMDSARFESELSAKGVRYAKLDYARLTLEPRNLIRYIVRFPVDLWQTARWLRRHQVDMVHVNGSYQFRSALAAFVARKKIVWHVNDAKMHGLVKAVFLALAPRLSDGFIFSSDIARRYYFPRGDDIRLIPSATIAPPVEVERFRRKAFERDRPAAQGEPITIVTITGINPDKGVDCFIEAAALIHARHSETRFKVGAAVHASQQTYFNELVQLVRNRGLTEEVFQFVGFVDDVPQFLAEGDVFLYTSNTEAGPAAVWEAMAAGLPVVTTRVGAIPEYMVDGVHALIAPPRDAKRLAELTLQLIGDPGLRAELGRAASSIVASALSVDAAARKHAALYRMVVEGKSPESRTCARCIMDTSDPHITFDADGLCDYCRNFDGVIKPNWHTDARGAAELGRLAERIKADGRGRDFDCIIGISGGLDSSYAAYVARVKMGLRPLLVHVDAGWNTDQAVGNIEKLVDGLGLDLYTEVVNWEEMKDLQVAFLKSGIPDQDLVQDAAFFSALYKFARQHGIRHVITGSNFSTECCREPEEWGGYLGIDATLFRDIHRRFGARPLASFPLTDILRYKLVYQKMLGMQVHYPLNLVPYVKKDAEDELGRLFGWQRFQHKHHESRFTRFYEDYWLPRRFGFEKRRAHFSSLILTGQMTREEALARISRPEMDEHFLKQEFEYVARKLDLTEEELQKLFETPRKTYRDYRNKHWLIGFGANALRRLGLEKRYFR